MSDRLFPEDCERLGKILAVPSGLTGRDREAARAICENTRNLSALDIVERSILAGRMLQKNFACDECSRSPCQCPIPF